MGAESNGPSPPSFFLRLAAERTEVTLHHDGWGTGGQWDRAFEYFQRAWKEVVLPRLRYRFSVGPVDWKDPPELTPAEKHKHDPEEREDRDRAE